MSRTANNLRPLTSPSPSSGPALANDPQQVMLIGLTPSIAAHLMTPLRSVAPGAELQMTRPADLETPVFPDGTLLIVQDRTPEADGLEILRWLRADGVESPAILIVTCDEFRCPHDLDQLGDVDVLPLSEISRFALRRSLILLGSQRAREALLAEVGGKLRAYERLLAARDEERQRVLDVATALERRLSATEKSFQDSESEWAEKAARAGAYAAELEQRVAELEAGAAGRDQAGEDEERRARAEEDARHRRQHALELAFLRDERLQQEKALAELRQVCAAQEQELGELKSQQVQLVDMGTRLQASDGVRASQTQQILIYQRRLQEVEKHLSTIAALLQAKQGTDPAILLEQLAGRLAQVETVRSEQQDTIDRLSRSLAEQQIDNTLEKRQARRDVVERVDEKVRRCCRLGTPLICLMIGIDEPAKLRSELGSISYDFMQVQVAHRLQLTLRRSDVVMRYGDGELVLISDAKTVVEARSHAERLIRQVCAEPLELGNRRLSISLSVAILDYEPAFGGANEFLRRARGTLFEAQGRGRRQILVGTASSASALPPAPDAAADPRSASAS